jgi:hypothetical protein
LVGTEAVPPTTIWLVLDMYDAVIEIPLAFGSLNNALKYFTALACNTVLVSFDASLNSISAAVVDRRADEADERDHRKGEDDGHIAAPVAAERADRTAQNRGDAFHRTTSNISSVRF